jgi:hypothetical protein
MTDSTLAAAPAPAAASAAPATLAQLMQRLPGVVRGARWFWWIAGLSAVNVAIAMSQGQTRFVAGLAFTEIAHGLFASNIAVALAIDAFFIGGFGLLGLKAQQGAAWAFVLGIVVYVCDALVFVKVADWMSVAFHAFALFYIGKAFIDLRAAKKTTGIR